MSTTSPNPRMVDRDAASSEAITPDPAAVGVRAGASDLDPVTGPLPVLSLVDGHLQVTVRRGVTILGLDGALDDRLAEAVAEPIRRAVTAADAVLLELDRVTLLDRTGLDLVLDSFDTAPDGAPRSLVAGRLSGRLVLDRWDVPGRFAVFTSVPDALQALAFAENGYGNGWGPAE